mmetsp:Transcript_37838/g.118574  ORF Transcript_37838/g.118574 Transcript_37838/m.118574 type:complete len:87 (+) Transcript_37838:1443-1703(+)
MPPAPGLDSPAGAGAGASPCRNRTQRKITSAAIASIETALVLFIALRFLYFPAVVVPYCGKDPIVAEKLPAAPPRPCAFSGTGALP